MLLALTPATVSPHQQDECDIEAQPEANDDPSPQDHVRTIGPLKSGER
jgi:hypothetical protein